MFPDGTTFNLNKVNKEVGILLSKFVFTQNNKVTVNSQSTALALIMMSPYIIGSSTEQRKSIAEKAVTLQTYNNLVSKLETILTTDAENVLDYSAHSDVYQNASEISIEALTSFGSNLLKKMNQSTETIYPTIEDVIGPDITLVNPFHIYYGVGVHNYGYTSFKETFVLENRSVFAYQLGWPPVYLAPPINKNYSLGDGQFTIDFYKGIAGPVDQILNWQHPYCNATWCNLGTGIIAIIDLVLGFAPKQPNFIKLADYAEINRTELIVKLQAISRDMVQEDWIGITNNFINLVAELGEPIGLWLWDKSFYESGNYLYKIGGILSNCTVLLKITSAAVWTANNGPFFWDLIWAPNYVSYDIQQTNGHLGDITTTTSSTSTSSSTTTTSPTISTTTTSIGPTTTTSTIYTTTTSTIPTTSTTTTISGNNPPYQPSNPNPPNGSTGVGEWNNDDPNSGVVIVNPLSWSGGDPDGNTVTYHVYLGTSFSNLVLKWSLPQIGGLFVLNPNTKYYWQVIAEDTHGARTEGPIWNFTTIQNSNTTTTSSSSTTTTAATTSTTTTSIGGLATMTITNFNVSPIDLTSKDYGDNIVLSYNISFSISNSVPYNSKGCIDIYLELRNTENKDWSIGYSDLKTCYDSNGTFTGSLESLWGYPAYICDKARLLVEYQAYRESGERQPLQTLYSSEYSIIH
ncbi:MAG: hypothetical protein ACFFDN_11190 [Candidatus Hodarchaeota archaeon]